MTQTLTPEGAIKHANLGWDGSAWHKLPMMFGWSDTYAEQISSLTMPAGNSSLNGSIVPAGEVWVVNGLSVAVTSTSCTNIIVVYAIVGANLVLGEQFAPVNGRYYLFTPGFVMKAGQYAYARFYGMTLNDNAFVNLWGYKMKVAE